MPVATGALYSSALHKTSHFKISWFYTSRNGRGGPQLTLDGLGVLLDLTVGRPTNHIPHDDLAGCIRRGQSERVGSTQAVVVVLPRPFHLWQAVPPIRKLRQNTTDGIPKGIQIWPNFIATSNTDKFLISPGEDIHEKQYNKQ